MSSDLRLRKNDHLIAARLKLGFELRFGGIREAKAGLEILLQQQRPRSNDGQVRELLAQPHVDLAKTWWILADPLDAFDGLG